MAEGIARHYAAQRGRAIEARSAGTLHIEGRPADRSAVAVCAEIGIDISQHRSQGLTGPLVDWADYVLVMEFGHANHIRDHHPDCQELIMLGHMAGMMEIGDPIGRWKPRFRRSRDEIRRCVESLIDRLPPKGKITP